VELAVIMFCCGLSAAVIGKIKGSSFLIWFLVGAVLPIIGTIAALSYRWEREELLRKCEECGNVVSLSDQVCMRCGRDLEWPEQAFRPRPAR
jgi:endogenous inhibitor of DNA gyrase (YacG/DUF329 family)